MRYEIRSPEGEFSGEVAGVAFSGGSATLDDGQRGAAAALAYFGRKGYSVKPVNPPAAAESEPAGPFDPGAHDVASVLAYLDAADDAESARVLAAEKAGKARKTILARAPEGDRASELNGGGQ
jgi:hypothetical protein